MKHFKDLTEIGQRNIMVLATLAGLKGVETAPETVLDFITNIFDINISFGMDFGSAMADAVQEWRKFIRSTPEYKKAKAEHDRTNRSA